MADFEMKKKKKLHASTRSQTAQHDFTKQPAAASKFSACGGFKIFRAHFPRLRRASKKVPPAAGFKNVPPAAGFKMFRARGGLQNVPRLRKVFQS